MFCVSEWKCNARSGKDVKPVETSFMSCKQLLSLILRRGLSPFQNAIRVLIRTRTMSHKKLFDVPNMFGYKVHSSLLHFALLSFVSILGSTHEHFF